MADVGRTLRTLARLNAGQVMSRIRRTALSQALERSDAPLRFAPPLNGGPYGPPARWMTVPIRASRLSTDDHTADDVRRGRLTLVGHAVELGDEWTSWNVAQAPVLTQYHLHYFDWMWALEDTASLATLAEQVIAGWRDRHPVGRRPAWDPYPTALRAWNLCAMDRQFGLLERMPGLPQFLDEHARVLRLLLERDLGGNHLIADLKALAGLAVWRADTASLTWAMRELGRALRTQVLADGGHEERSPAYHAHVLADLLDVRELLEGSNLPVPCYLSRTIAEMQRWLRTMAAPDGTLPIFNDGDQVRPEVVIDLLGAPAPSIGAPIQHLAASGFVVAHPTPDIHLVVDVGAPGPRNQPGHAHAGVGAFELWIHGERVFRNTGSSTYEAGGRRDYERSTAAQNVLTVDGRSQSELWGAFRVGRSPAVLAHVPGPSSTTFSVEHDGYRTARGPARHRRTFELAEGHLMAEDQLDGAGHVNIDVRLHTELEVHPPSQGQGQFRVGPVTVSWPGQQRIQATSSPTELARGLGRTRGGSAITASTDSDLPTVVRTRIAWGA